MASIGDGPIKVGQNSFVVLKIGVNHRDNRGSRRKSAFDHRGRQATTADAADHADAAVGLGDASEKIGCAVGRSIVDENRLPLDPGKRDSKLFEQRLDIAGFVERRNDDAQLQWPLNGLDLQRRCSAGA